MSDTVIEKGVCGLPTSPPNTHSSTFKFLSEDKTLKAAGDRLKRLPLSTTGLTSFFSCKDWSESANIKEGDRVKGLPRSFVPTTFFGFKVSPRDEKSRIAIGAEKFVLSPPS